MNKMKQMMFVSALVWVASVIVNGAIGQETDTGPQPKNNKDDVAANEKVGPPPKWGGLTVYRLGEELPKSSHVFILMHGLGGTGKDFVPLAKILTVSKKTCFIFPEAPNGLPRGGRAWVRNAADIKVSRDKVVDLLRYIEQENPKAEVVLGGFSQGATLASTFLEKDSNLVEGLVLLSPFGHLPEPLTGKSETKPLVFLSHGKSDRVLPFQGSEELHEKLVGFKFDVDWLAFDGGHNIPQEVVTRFNQFLKRMQEDKEDASGK